MGGSLAVGAYLQKASVHPQPPTPSGRLTGVGVSRGKGVGVRGDGRCGHQVDKMTGLEDVGEAWLSG